MTLTPVPGVRRGAAEADQPGGDGRRHEHRRDDPSLGGATRSTSSTASSCPTPSSAIGARILKEIRERLGFLENVGVGYLTLDRAAATLSGGEAQRIRLATQIGSSLMGVLYILDEPSIGLHQRDNEKLLATLSRLRTLGNTLIVVEHDEETIRAADHVVDMGPGRR